MSVSSQQSSWKIILISESGAFIRANVFADTAAEAYYGVMKNVSEEKSREIVDVHIARVNPPIVLGLSNDKSDDYFKW